MGGYHWYEVASVGYPDPSTFDAARLELGAFHDELWDRTGLGPDQTVLGGFSMGAVMSYALGLDGERPAPSGVLALSGFIPHVDGWEPSLAERAGLPVFVSHGRHDEVIGVSFARDAVATMRAAGLDVSYAESDAAHNIEPAVIPEVRTWLTRVLGRVSPPA
jgi:phospholipase/carboxylesterase